MMPMQQIEEEVGEDEKMVVID
jgi:hypothetical protein